MLRDWGEDNVAVQNIGQGHPRNWVTRPGPRAFNTNAWPRPAACPAWTLPTRKRFGHHLRHRRLALYPRPHHRTSRRRAGLVQNPAVNYGWMFLCGDEGTRFTAKRFGSRENAIRRAAATGAQLCHPLRLPRITRAELNGTNFLLGFQARRDTATVWNTATRSTARIGRAADLVLFPIPRAWFSWIPRAADALLSVAGVLSGYTGKWGIL